LQSFVEICGFAIAKQAQEFADMPFANFKKSFLAHLFICITYFQTVKKIVKLIQKNVYIQSFYYGADHCTH
jgi:hypothetical protein